MARNKFIDPAGVRPDYSWAVNHDVEDQAGRSRNITRTANTANVGVIRQQGDREPLLPRWTGTLLTQAQHDEMWAWFNLCEEHAIFLEDFAGTVYEVLITDFNPVRKRVSRNLHDLANAPLHIWTYTIAFDVLRIVSGPLAGVIE